MRLMPLRFLKSAVALSLLALPAVGFAQSQTSANEDERLEALIRESETVYVPKSTVTVGFRVLNSGPKTSFGNLGSVDVASTIAPASAGAVDRFYMNGGVGADAVRTEEKNTDGTQKPPDANGRYQTYTSSTNTETGVVTQTLTGDYLSYVAGQSRVWQYTDAAQATARPGYIAMSNYSATSGGGSAFKEQGMTAGVELQMEYRLSKPTSRFQFSIVAGIAISDINNQTSGSVVSDLRTRTDYYSLLGKPAPDLGADGAIYNAPVINTITDDAGAFVRFEETTTPISQTQTESLSEDTVLEDGVTVDGNWQVKGNYFLVRVGPQVRTKFTERLGASASIGMAGAYAGTRYTAIESFTMPDVNSPISTEVFSTEKKLLSGYYADFNLEFTANERTGFYGGVTAQQFGDYTQTLGERTAVVDLGSAVGLRGGVSIKF